MTPWADTLNQTEAWAVKSNNSLSFRKKANKCFSNQSVGVISFDYTPHTLINVWLHQRPHSLQILCIYNIMWYSLKVGLICLNDGLWQMWGIPIFLDFQTFFCFMKCQVGYVGASFGKIKWKYSIVLSFSFWILVLVLVFILHYSSFIQV